MLTNETIIKTLLGYGFSWDEVEYYIRNPAELKKILEKMQNNHKR